MMKNTIIADGKTHRQENGYSNTENGYSGNTM
jgi:hypothetical protein